ncbi:MAG: ABC transporter permease subunit [Anaerolineae bacterium]|nr:ABC transporter permease subunit [Anaerolineae bacterium]
MMTDILTVIQKELREFLLMRGTRFGGKLNLLIVIGLLGVYMPVMNGRGWVTNAIGPVSFAWLPLFMAIGMVADSFAGERERHTLETLLASRLPDRAILFGKIGAAVAYCMGINVAGLLVGAVVANLMSLEQGLVFYPLDVFAGMLLFSLLLALLISSIGALVSLRAATVRQAYQSMSVGLMILWVGIFLVIRFAPESVKTAAIGWFETANRYAIFGAAAGVVLVLTLLFMGLAMQRFQRAKLILD